MDKLSDGQTFTLLLVSLLGTSIIIGTPKTASDVWLVDLLTILPGAALLLLYGAIGSRLSPKGLFPLLVRAWGRIVGRFLVLAYSVYLLLIVSRNIRDMLELVQTALLITTPTTWLAILFVMVMGYAVSGGIKVIGGLSQVVAAYILLFFTLILVFLILSDIMVPVRMLPLLSEGWLPIIRTSLHNSIWVPYGEMIVFLALFDRLETHRGFHRNIYYSVGLAGFILTLSDLMQIWTLGIPELKLSAFPLLDAARMINVDNFITRLDSLVAMIIILSVLVKSALFFYAGLRGTAFVFGQSYRRYVVPFALFVAAVSILVSANYAEHVTEGLRYFPLTLHLPFQLLIPLLSAAIVCFRMRGGRGHGSSR